MKYQHKHTLTSISIKNIRYVKDSRDLKFNSSITFRKIASLFLMINYNIYYN